LLMSRYIEAGFSGMVSVESEAHGAHKAFEPGQRGRSGD